MYGVSASRRRLATWIRCGGSVALLAAAGGVVDAQIVTRDSLGYDRVYRVQARQLADTNYMRALRAARVQLRLRLDSLQHAFEDMSLESPDRALRLREISALLASLANLSALEEVGRAKDAERSARTLRSRTMLLGGEEGVFARPLPSAAVLRRGWIGINVEAPHQQLVRGDTEFIRYFSYPEIVSVEPNSPAERVGITRGDRLVAYDGADVRDREINVTRLLQPSRHIMVTVRRDGEDRDFSLTVVKAPQRLIIRRSLSMPDQPPNAPVPPAAAALPRSGALRLRMTAPVMVFDKTEGSSSIAGASLSEIRDEGLGHIFGVASGLLVTEVFSDPAESSGLKGGDVIVGADGQDITRLAQLRRIISAHNDDRSVELEIVRQKRTRSITLRW